MTAPVKHVIIRELTAPVALQENISTLEPATQTVQLSPTPTAEPAPLALLHAPPVSTEPSHVRPAKPITSSSTPPVSSPVPHQATLFKIPAV